MIQGVFLLGLGLVGLYFGAEWIVRGGSRLALRLGITPLVVGLTIVAFGTSLPELIVSVVAALEGKSAIAIGNVVGSNVANVGLVLGLSALIFPISISFSAIRRDILIYLGVCVVFILFAYDGRISPYEGVILFSGLVLYVFICLGNKNNRAASEGQEGGQLAKEILLLMAGIGVLSYGAKLFVDGAVQLAQQLGISEVAIGMSIVALGTSLPELATSTMAALRRQSGISIGNIIGSNLFNLLSVIGLAAILRPLEAPRSILSFEIPVMVAFGIVLIPVTLLPQPISRLTSLGLLLAYGLFLWHLF